MPEHSVYQKNRRARTRSAYAIKREAKENWNNAVRNNDDDEMRRILAENGKDLFGTTLSASIEAEQEVSHYLDTLEVEDELDY